MADNGATSASKAGSAVNFVQTGVAAVGGIVDAINGSFNAASTAIGNIFSSIGQGVKSTGISLPLNNPLHSYASYSYVISMYCLSNDEHNYPDSSYIAGRISTPAILKSASADPNNRIRTAAGKYDFYIDNLVLSGYYGFEKGTGLTNTMSFEFTVAEPYSMGQFMVAVQQAAYQLNYDNFNDAPYLLTIEFFGMDQLGVPKKVPKTTKYIPFKFNQMNMKVNGAGSVYNCVAIPTNATSTADSVRLTKAQATIKGKTVQEMLQTGPHSLQAALNYQQEELKKRGLVAVPDEYVIIFPNSLASAPGAADGDQAGSSLSSNKVVGATKDVSSSFSDSRVLSKLGVSRSSITKTLVQPEGACNAIGKAPMGHDSSRAGNPSMPPDETTFDPDTGTPNKSQIKTTPGLVDYKFSRGTDILKIINEVILKSTYSKIALDGKQIDNNGMRPMWRVDVQTFATETKANKGKTNTYPKLHVYRVYPYQMHASKVLLPGAGAPNIDKLKEQAVKVYNYIYTGNNRDILKFEFEISNAFFALFGVDYFSKTSDEQMRAKQSGPTDKERIPGDENGNINLDVPDGGKQPFLQALPQQAKFSLTSSSSEGQGGSVGELQETRAMRLLLDALKSDTDMLNITMDIAGDPYYIANSGLGNYSATQESTINIHADGSISYQNGEVDIVIYFRSPVDINQTTGLYDFNKNTYIATMFSGLYKLTDVISTFKGGKFTQTLRGYRRPGQELENSKDVSNNQMTSQMKPSESAKPSEG